MQDAHNAGRKRYASLIARVAVAAGAIIWAFHGQDWRTLAKVFQNLSPWFFGLIVLIYTAAQVIIACRWWLLLRAQSIRVDVLTAIRLFFLGLFYNNLMPGALGGDLLKAWYVTKHTDKMLEGVLSIFVDRMVGLIGAVVMAIFSFLVLLPGQAASVAKKEAGASGWLGRHSAVILWVVLAMGVVFVATLVHPGGRMRLARGIGRVGGRGLSLLRRVKDAMIVYCSKPWTLLGAIMLTLIGQSIVILGFWLLGRDLGVQAGPSHYFVIFPASWVIGAIPISPAGLGVTEAGIVGLFKVLAGATGPGVRALALCQRFIWILSSLPGGLIHVLGAHLPAQEISVDGQERTN